MRLGNSQLVGTLPMPTWLAKMWLALLLLLWAGAHCHTVIAAPSGMVWEEALHEISLLRETVSATELPAAPASALTPPDLTPDAEHALCAQLCPGSPEHCGVKFIYGTGTVYCCTLALYVQGSIGHVCADSSQPHLVPEAALTSAVQASVHAGSIDKPTPAPLPNDRNKTDLAVGGRYALERVNQVRVAQRLDPIVWNEQVSDSGPARKALPHGQRFPGGGGVVASPAAKHLDRRGRSRLRQRVAGAQRLAGDHVGALRIWRGGNPEAPHRPAVAVLRQSRQVVRVRRHLVLQQ
eukprot:ctg_465.g178